MPSVYTPVAAPAQPVMVSPWKPGLEFAEKYSALLVGPALAGDRLPAKLRTGVAQLWRDLPIPMIVDASALSWLPRASRSAKYLRLITPHPGEAARLLKKTSKEVQEDRVGSLRALSNAFGGTWL